MASFTKSAKVLENLCFVSKNACDIMAPMVLTFYNAINGETSKLKADKSVFTIADGIVQHLLVNHLYAKRFSKIVGEEEDSQVNISVKPYTVDDLTVPVEFESMIDEVRNSMDALSVDLDHHHYDDFTVFIDPIDGTREFATALGEQCSICIGFSDIAGKPIAGIVYRPITSPPTWAAGAASESVALGQLDMAATPCTNGFLTSNGSISKYIGQLMTELNYVRVPSGGAGNKMLMVLEGKGNCYIQDRGVSRWDTCGAHAVIEAYGGVMSKLTTFAATPSTIASYTYLKSATNLDFEPNTANLTPYNASDKASVVKGVTTAAADVSQVKAYSNLCGVFALNASAVASADALTTYHAAIQRAAAVHPAAYD